MSLDIYLTAVVPTTVYDGNVTTNLTAMAREAGIYKHLWCPEEIKITHAVQLIEPLEVALIQLYGDPERFKKHNPPNGWGDYDGFVSFVENLLKACKAYPTAEIHISR